MGPRGEGSPEFSFSLKVLALRRPLVSAFRIAPPGSWEKEMWELIDKGEGGQMRVGDGGRREEGSPAYG